MQSSIAVFLLILAVGIPGLALFIFFCSLTLEYLKLPSQARDSQQRRSVDAA
jgi:hypothetical protein